MDEENATVGHLPNTASIAFEDVEDVEGEDILLLLNKEGIAASSGSARTTGWLETQHVIRAIGIPYTAAHGTIRFTLSRYNTETEVDRVIARVPPKVGTGHTVRYCCACSCSVAIEGAPSIQASGARRRSSVSG